MSCNITTFLLLLCLSFARTIAQGLSECSQSTQPAPCLLVAFDTSAAAEKRESVRLGSSKHLLTVEFGTTKNGIMGNVFSKSWF